MTLLQIAGAVAVAQSLLIAISLVSKKTGSRTGNVLLSALFVSFALLTAGFAALGAGFGRYERWYEACTLATGASFLIGPLLLLYVKSLVVPRYRMSRNDWTHFAAFLVFAIALVVVFLLADNWRTLRRYLPLVISAAVIIHNGAYFAWTIRRLAAARGASWLRVLAAGEAEFAWLRVILPGFIVLWLSRLQFCVVGDITTARWCPYKGSTYIFGAFVFSNILLYLIIRSVEILPAHIRYEKSDLDELEKRRRKEELLRLMDTRKPHLNPSLTMSGLARELRISPRHLSQIINEMFGRNFCDFVNGYRIEESKRLLSDPAREERSILDIAYEVGFNSKSTFNSAFKKHTGMKPSEFRAVRSALSRPA
jgi:AraC-like DNA-binding protein